MVRASASMDRLRTNTTKFRLDAPSLPLRKPPTTQGMLLRQCPTTSNTQHTSMPTSRVIEDTTPVIEIARRYPGHPACFSEAGQATFPCMAILVYHWTNKRLFACGIQEFRYGTSQRHGISDLIFALLHLQLHRLFLLFTAATKRHGPSYPPCVDLAIVLTRVLR